MLDFSTDRSVTSLVDELRLAVWEAQRESFPCLGRVLDQWRSELELLGAACRPARALNDAVRGAASALETWRAVRSW